jgi:hypothetical protein
MAHSTEWKVDTALKIVAALVALFGVWKFFSDQSTAETLRQRAASVEYVEKFGDANHAGAKEELFKFWVSQTTFTAHAADNGLSEREYRNFVQLVVPEYERSEELRKALIAISSYFDQAIFCREASLCDGLILDEFLCETAKTWDVAYQPFFESLNRGIASKELGRGLHRMAEQCR